jgi:transglutaminase-like putative cysteine protease
MNETKVRKHNMKRFLESSGPGGFSRLKSWPVWIGIALWLAVSGVTTLSFQLVHWTNPQPAYILILTLSIVLALVNFGLNKPVWMTVFIWLAGGIFVAVWQSVILFRPPVEYGLLQSIGYAFSEWGKALTRTAPNENNIHFSLFLVIVTWVWGYWGTWRLLKKNSVWPTLLFGLIIILVNLAFLNKSYFGYFYAYIFLSMVLISYTHFIKQYYHNGNFPSLSARIPIWITALMVVFAGILILFTFLTPAIRSDRLRTIFESNIKQSASIEKLKINVFNSVSSKGTVVKSTEQDIMRFNSRPNLSDEIQFRVTSSGVPNYWRVRRYDIYNAWGWSTNPYINIMIGAGETQPPNVTPAERNNISYTVMNKIKTDIILSSGKYLFTNAPVILHYFDSLNPDITANPDDNLVSVSTPHIYQVDDSYVVNSEIIKPTISELKAANANFPLWITNQYLQLPADIPVTITRLSRNTVRGNVTEYDKVMSITNYLSRMKYVLEGTYPPENKDAVEDFLLVQRSGNCTNFASAAVVMLRSVGIPARFCTGYIPHYVDRSGNTFVLLAKDYHAWPEVYFPGYGWIEFEVTPGAPSGNIVEDTTGNSVPGLSSANINDFPPYYPINPTPASVTSADNQPAISPGNQSSHWAVIITIGFLVITGILALWVIWRKKMRRQDTISDIMARMYLFSPLIGVPFRSYQTTCEYAEDLSSTLPHHRLEIEKLTQIYLVNRYSRNKLVILQNEYLLAKYWRSIFWGMIKRIVFRF